MEGGLSIQTKLSLIKNEREERSLKSRVEKIDQAKSLWVISSDHNRNVFLRDHSRLISRAQLLFEESHNGRTQGEISGVGGSKDVKNRRRIKREFLPLVTYQSPTLKIPASETKGSLEKQLCEEPSVMAKSRREYRRAEDTLETEIEIARATAQSKISLGNTEKNSVIPSETRPAVENVFPSGEVLPSNQGTETDDNGAMNCDNESDTTLEICRDIVTVTDESDSKNEVDVEQKTDTNFNETDTNGGIKGNKALIDETGSKEGDTKCELQYDDTVARNADDANAEAHGDNIGDGVTDNESSGIKPEQGLVSESNINRSVNTEKHGFGEADNDSEIETRKMRRSPSLVFITDLGQIEEEDDETMSSEQEAPATIPVVIRSTQTPTRRRIQSIPSLSPIKDVAEDQEENYSQPEVEETNPIATEEKGPETETGAVSKALGPEGEGEDDSLDEYIEQVRISNTLSPSERALSQGVKQFKQVTPRFTKSYTFQKSEKNSPRRNSSSGGLLMHRKSVGNLAYLVSRSAGDSVPRRFKAQPLCKRYEQAVIPPEFNLDFITRILRKKAAKNKSNEEDDEDEEYSNNEFTTAKKKKVKRRVVISPAKPRVVWSPAKWSTLPECRYLRLPPLVQIGYMA